MRQIPGNFTDFDMVEDKSIYFILIVLIYLRFPIHQLILFLEY